MLGRRGFLQGIFNGVAATGLIVAAKPSDIELFTAPLTKGDPVILDQPIVNQSTASVGEHLYNSRGEIVAIVESIKMERPKVDVTSFASKATLYDYEWAAHITITAIGLGHVELGERKPPKLRGRK